MTLIVHKVLHRMNMAYILKMTRYVYDICWQGGMLLRFERDSSVHLLWMYDFLAISTLTQCTIIKSTLWWLKYVYWCRNVMRSSKMSLMSNQYSRHMTHSAWSPHKLYIKSRRVGRCKILGRPEQQIFAKRLTPLKICAVKSDKLTNVPKFCQKIDHPLKIGAVKSDKQSIGSRMIHQ